MLMVRGSTKLLVLMFLLLWSLVPSALLPQNAHAQISEVGLDCYGFEFRGTISSPTIEAIVAFDTPECESVPGVIWELGDEPVDGDVNLIPWNYAAGAGGEAANGNIVFNTCTGQHTLFIGNQQFPITVAGDFPGLGFECQGQDPDDPDPDAEFGSARFEVTINNLQDLLFERSIGPFLCIAHRTPAGSVTYETEIPELPIGARVPTETLTCDFIDIPAGNYYIELIELNDDGTRTLRVTTSELAVGAFITTFFRETVTIEQFEEGQVGFAQTEYAQDSQRCKTGSFNLPFRWILCPMITLLFNTINVLYTGLIIPVLYYSPLNESSGNEVDRTLFDIWNSFRIIGNVLFVIAFLLAIFGQSLAGFQLFSAYELRRILPRLVIGIIGVNISWWFVGFTVDVFNILGAGIRGLILAPVDGLEFTVNFDLEGNWNELASTIGIIGGVTAGLWVGGVVMGLPLILWPIIAGLVLAFITILIRRALITMLILTAPIAFVAWILPNTAGMFRQWWSWFWKALLVYPIIVALLASGELFAKIITASNQVEADTQASVFNSLIAVIALFAPYFFIPFSFRFAGGVLTALAGGLDQRGQRANRRIFGDIRDPRSYRGRRRTRQVEGRVSRKQRAMNQFDRARNSQVGTGPGAGRMKRGLGAAIRGGGRGAFFAGNLTGRNYAAVAADQNEQAMKRVKQWWNQGDKDRVHAILGDKNLISGSYENVLDDKGNVVGTEYVGKDLNPAAVLAARNDQKSPAMVQAALNLVLSEAAGQVDSQTALLDAKGKPIPGTEVNKVQQVYEQVFGGGARDDFDTQSASLAFGFAMGGKKLSEAPRAQAAYNKVFTPLGRRFDAKQRKQMLSRAADYNASHSPDNLFRDPSSGWSMPGYTSDGAGGVRAMTDADEGYDQAVRDQGRYLSRINERLSDDRAMNELGPSAWNGLGEVMANAQRVYQKGLVSTPLPAGVHGPPAPPAFDSSRLSPDERDFLAKAYRTHEGLNLSQSGARNQGTARGNAAKESIQSQMYGFMGGKNSPVSTNLRENL